MLKKVFAISSIVALMFAMVPVVPAQAATIVDGGEYTCTGGCFANWPASAVFLVQGSNLYAYASANVWRTYHPGQADFSTVETVSAADLASYTVAGYVSPKVGVFVKAKDTSFVGEGVDIRTVYLVGLNGVFHPVYQASVYKYWTGDSNFQNIYLLPDAFTTVVAPTISTMIDSTTTAPIGMAAMAPNGDYGYVAAGNTFRAFSSEVALTANKFGKTWSAVLPVTLSAGSQVTGAESAYVAYQKKAASAPPVSGQIIASVASDSPASGSIIADDTTGVMTNSPMLKLVFSNGSSTAVNVNTIKLTRGGISADTDFNNVYLYEGDNWVADMASSSTKTYTFYSSTGLFTIPANSIKTMTVKGQLVVSTTAGKTISLSVAASTDIVANATVNGSFPITGNLMTTALVTDLGYVNLGNVTTATFPATIDPSTTISQELWRFTATATSQDMDLRKLVLTEVGTITNTDLVDLKLSVFGIGNVEQLGAIATIGSDSKLTFDLSSSPYKMTKGQAKTFVLEGKVAKGTGRAFKFTIRTVNDLVTYDRSYGVITTPTNNTAAFTVYDPDASADGTNINNGTVTVSVSADSPTGNITAGLTDVSLAKFSYTANGEDVKVSYVRVFVNEETSDQNIDNGKLYYNGSQVGVNNLSVLDEGTVTTDTGALYSLGNTVIIPAGTTGVFEYRADTTQGAGTALAAGQTLVVSLTAGTTDATGQTSLANIATSAATAKLLTVRAGTMTLVKNTSMADYSATTPTGVPGTTNVKVASMVFTAGTGEGARLSQVVVGDEDVTSATSDFGDSFQNLKPMHGTTQLATTQGALAGTEGENYTFSISPAVVIAVGEQYVIDWYADVKTITAGAGFYATAEPGLEFVSATATGVNTGTSVSGSLSITDLQNIYIASTGSLTITANAATPVTNQLVMGTTDATMAILDFTTGPGEAVNVNTIIITDTTSYGGSLGNIKLYDGSTQIGSTIAGLSAESNGTATFNLTTPWVIAQNVTKVLTVKATANVFGNAVAGGSHVVNIADADAVTTLGAGSGAAITETVSSATGEQMDIYRTKVAVAKNSGSPSGSASTNTNATVLIFDVAANPGYNAALNAVAVTMNGTVDTTGSSSAYLYKEGSSTPISTEAYVTEADATSGSTTSWVASGGITGGIPVGANIRIYDDSTSLYHTATYEVTTVSSTGYAFTPAASVAVAANDDIYYRPMQPGTGKVYFGAQTTLTANLADAATTATVTSTDGFSYGDTIYVAGYDTLTGAAVARVSGCVISDLTATVITMSACHLTSDLTIDYDYVSGTPANARVKGHQSAAIVYTGLSAGSSQSIAAGDTMTFTVKGDTTGATTAETLNANISAIADLNWDDTVHFGVTTITKDLPIYGGTLTY